jgi:hypothetical protein
MGFLLVNSLSDGEYEVYKILGDATLQFVSNQIGQRNKKLPLNAGSYLILSDCSYKMALIYPHKTTELVTHTIHFNPPKPAEPGDIFNIQCNRHQQTHPPQYINQRFELTVFPSSIDMLVGMRPLKLNLSGEIFNTPQNLTFNLSMLRVAPATTAFKVEPAPYFISPSDGQLAVTQSQDFGKWQFLLPGTYTITVNGTQRQVSLKENESISIEPSYIKLEVSPAVNIDRYLSIKGEPYTAEFNDRRTFTINTIYPFISETVHFRLDGETKASVLTLKPTELINIPLRSVEVSLNCGPWEWECLGKRDISLFETDSPYPFMHGNSDLPILFSKEDVQIEIEGAQSLRYKIERGKRDSVFETGQVLLKPKPTHKAGQLSLLVRVEGDGNVSGQSYDIPYIRDSRMHLITGSYFLNHYHVLGAHTQTGGVQLSSRSTLMIKKGDLKELGFDYYLSEEKLQSLSQPTTRMKGVKQSLLKRPFLAF